MTVQPVHHVPEQVSTMSPVYTGEAGRGMGYAFFIASCSKTPSSPQPAP